MGFWERQSNVTVTLPAQVKDALTAQAVAAKLSLSKYVAGMLQSSQPIDGAAYTYCRPVRFHGGSFVTTIPPEIVSALEMQHKQPLAWSLVRGGAVVRVVTNAS